MDPPSDPLPQRLGEILGEAPGRVPDDYRVDGAQPRWQVAPSDEEGFCSVLALAASEGMAVVPRGSGSRDRLGAPLDRADLVLSTGRLDAVVEHEPADLTVTVQAGMTLEALGRALARHGQRLPLDPPHGGTVGGVVATATAGPRQLAYGGPRDLVLGLRVALSHGHAIQAGGRVVKNVAGYDLCKLFTGSMGTLGVITEATFKVRPVPEATATVILSCRDAEAAASAAQAVLASELLPAALEVVNAPLAARLGVSGPYALLVALEETEAGVRYQRERVGGLGAARPTGTWVERRDLEGDLEIGLWRDWRAWAARREVSLALTCGVAPADAVPLLAHFEAERPALLPDCTLEATAGAGTGILRLSLVRTAGGEPPSAGTLVRFAEAVAAKVGPLGGHCAIADAPAAAKERLALRGNGGEALPLMQAIRERFDPRGILSPGRFFAGS